MERLLCPHILDKMDMGDNLKYALCYVFLPRNCQHPSGMWEGMEGANLELLEYGAAEHEIHESSEDNLNLDKV